MTVHFYFVPMVVATVGGISYRQPKYIKSKANPTGITAPSYAVDYGLIDVAFLAADTTITDHQTLFDAIDVLSIDPRSGTQRNLDELATSAEINALTSYLDTAENFCPMGWATADDTRISIIKGVCGMFLFIQRVCATAGSDPRSWGITLGSAWSSLTAQQQGWFRQSAIDLGYNVVDPSSEVTIRNILRYFGANWGDKPIYMGVLGKI